MNLDSFEEEVPKVINNDAKSVYKERLELLSAFEKPNLYKKVQLINQIIKEFNFSISDILIASNILTIFYQVHFFMTIMA